MGDKVAFFFWQVGSGIAFASGGKREAHKLPEIITREY